MLKLIGLVSMFLFFSSTSMAAEKKAVAANDSEMRCEKLLATSIAEFKASLVQNCNLNKPFSTSLSKTLNDEVYFYCCHKN